MPDGVTIQGVEDIGRLGAAYRAGGKELRTRIRKAMQEAAKPLAVEVRDKGAAKMPHRGGLSGRIAAARAGVSLTASTRSTAVAIRLGTREKYDLRSMDLGRLRHPTYGHRPWVSQTVPAGAFTEPFQDGSTDVRNRVSAEVARLLDEIAREASN